MRSETHTRYRSADPGNRTDMSHDQLRALMEHAHDAGCVNLSALTQLVTEMDLGDDEVSALYEQLEKQAIELTADSSPPHADQTHLPNHPPPAPTPPPPHLPPHPPRPSPP